MVYRYLITLLIVSATLTLSKVCTATTNLALNKPVHASHQLSTADRVTDGDSSPNARAWNPGAIGGDRYIEVNFQQSVAIQSARVSAGTRGKRSIPSFQLRYSHGDGSQFLDVPGGSVTGIPNTNTELSLNFFTEITTSRVRLYCSSIANDGCLIRELQFFGETITTDNLPPVIESIADQTVAPNVSSLVTVSASDPEGDQITLSLQTPTPSFVSFSDAGDGTGSLLLTPGDTDIGDYQLAVVAADAELSSSQEFSLVVSSVMPPAGGTHTKIFRSDIPISDRREVAWPFWEYLPIGYDDSRTEGYPLLVFLHGSGEAGTNLAAVLRNGPPELISKGLWPSERPFIVISPQTTGNFNWNKLYKQIEYLKRRNNIDPGQVYLTGLSYGATAIYAFLKENGVRGRRNVAAVLPIAGTTKVVGQLASLCAASSTPSWAFHGANDRGPAGYNPNGSILPAQTVNNDCIPTTPWKVTIYQGIGHNVWDRTYSLDGMNASNISAEYDPFEQDIYQWLLSHTLD